MRFADGEHAGLFGEDGGEGGFGSREGAAFELAAGGAVLGWWGGRVMG